MTSNGTVFQAIEHQSSGKPRLLPFNRRLRHLRGITLRNLTLGNSFKHHHRKPLDDGAIPSAFQSPAKLLTQRENDKLVHSYSSENLREDVAVTEVQSGTDRGPTSNTPRTPERPRTLQARRRSTIGWDATPKQRQKRLEEAVSRHSADVFFAVHVEGVKDPIYISEVAERAMNPNFRQFDLSECNFMISRQSELTVTFWAKDTNSHDWHLLVRSSLSLGTLHFIGHHLEDFHHRLPENSIIFTIADGLYASFPNMSPIDKPLIETPTTVSNLETTSSYDALARLSTLDECIQDAIVVRDKLTKDINHLISSNQDTFSNPKELASATDSLVAVRRAVTAESKKISVLKSRIAEKRTSLSARRQAIEVGCQTQNQAQADLDENSSKLSTSHTAHKETTSDIHGQRRRICEDLLIIYPLDAVHGKTLAFTIRHLSLPNSNFSSNALREDVVSAALGNVAHLVHLLSYYLAIPLPYPIMARSSTSQIRDSISLVPENARMFPLYLGRGSIMYRFEYGVFLLNKDIELLGARLGLKLIDIRQTLPNLKYVLFVATAGKGELPSRKVGDVKGLLRETWASD